MTLPPPRFRRTGLTPGQIAARLERAGALHQAGDVAAARHVYERILRHDPGCWPARYPLAIAAYQQRDYRLAEREFRRVIGAAPAFPPARYNLGLVLQESGRFEEAVTWHDSAIALDPECAPAWANSGTALLALGELGQARQHFEMAVLCPDPAPEDRLNRAVANLLLGRWREGWADFEYRFQSSSHDGPRDLGHAWSGEPTRQPLRLWAEQGFGDTLMTLRYWPLVRGRAPNALLQVPPALARFIHHAMPDVPLLDPWPDAAAVEMPHVPMMSLPHLFATTPDTVPPLTIAVEPASLMPASYRVGLCWAGSRAHRNDARRSVPLEELRPLFALEGVTWQALQVERTEGLPDTPLAPLIATDWLETARIVAACDLVITVDTAVAHLAGLLGTPTWLLLAAWPDFRWMLETDRTPWYPSVALIRQQRVGDWSDVVDQVRQRLAAR